MREQSRCSTSQIVPLRVESIWEGVKPHIFGLWFEVLIGIRMEASMSNMDQEGYFCHSASQPNLLRNCTMKENCAQPA
jgi:hypothetical protein